MQKPVVQKYLESSDPLRIKVATESFGKSFSIQENYDRYKQFREQTLDVILNGRILKREMLAKVPYAR